MKSLANLQIVLVRVLLRSLISFPPDLVKAIKASVMLMVVGRPGWWMFPQKKIAKESLWLLAKVLLGQKAFHLVASNQVAKGDVLNVAKIAGINGAKQRSSLIPLCHNIGRTHIRVELALNEKDFSVEIEGEAARTGKTGVEMEAMAAVAVAGLTVYDMCKAAWKDISITKTHLEHKNG